MKKFTHAELAAAQERGDWDLLWVQAMPLVKLVVGRMLSGKERDEDVADDMVQQGMLIAGEAMRAWKPLECAFTTWIGNRVRDDLFNHVSESGNGGVGSYKQKPVVLSLGDERPNASSSADDEEADDDGTFEAALTYAGVVMPGGQYDGAGFVPAGFGDPSEEADLLALRERVRFAVDTLVQFQREILYAIHGLTGAAPESLREYATRTGLSFGATQRRYAVACEAVGQKLQNFRHS